MAKRASVLARFWRESSDTPMQSMSVRFRHPPRVELALGYTVINAIKILGSDNVSRQALREVMALAAEGRLSARVDRVLPLGQAAEAHQLIEDRKAFGRIVLVPDHD